MPELNYNEQIMVVESHSVQKDFMDHAKKLRKYGRDTPAIFAEGVSQSAKRFREAMLHNK